MRLPLLFSLAALVAPAAHAQGGSLAVLPLAGDAAPGARAQVEARVRLAAGRYAALQSTADTAHALRSAAALGLGCDLATEACARQMGGLASASRVLHGALLASGTLELELLGVEGQGPATRWREPLPDGGVARDAAIERAVLTLLAPERVSARLRLEVSPRGASVVVDEIFRGPAPLSAALVLTPGSHQVYVTHPGWLSQSLPVELDVGTEQRIIISLQRDPDAPVGRDPALAPVEANDWEGSAAQAEESDGAEIVAVLPLVAVGVAPRVVRALEDALIHELDRRAALVVVGPREAERVLAASAAGCAERPRCVADVARILRADHVLSGRLDRSGQLLVLQLRRHDGASGDPVIPARAAALHDNARRLLSDLPTLSEQLFPEQRVDPAAAPVDLDAYAARMSASPLSPWLFWTAAGVGGALAVATGAAGAVALTAPDPASAGMAGAAFAVGAGGTAVALGSAALLGVLVDWDAQ